MWYIPPALPVRNCPPIFIDPGLNADLSSTVLARQHQPSISNTPLSFHYRVSWSKLLASVDSPASWMRSAVCETITAIRNASLMHGGMHAILIGGLVLNQDPDPKETHLLVILDFLAHRRLAAAQGLIRSCNNPTKRYRKRRFLSETDRAIVDLWGFLSGQELPSGMIIEPLFRMRKCSTREEEERELIAVKRLSFPSQNVTRAVLEWSSPRIWRKGKV